MSIDVDAGLSLNEGSGNGFVDVMVCVVDNDVPFCEVETYGSLSLPERPHRPSLPIDDRNGRIRLKLPTVTIVWCLLVFCMISTEARRICMSRLSLDPSRQDRQAPTMLSRYIIMTCLLIRRFRSFLSDRIICFWKVLRLLEHMNVLYWWDCERLWKTVVTLLPGSRLRTEWLGLSCV